MERETNRRWLLASRPVGAPGLENFRLVEEPRPEPLDGEVVVRNLWLSVDPYMRGRMSDQPSYARPVAIGEVMTAGTVSKVVTSRSDEFTEGDTIVCRGGWQDYGTLPPGMQKDAYKVDDLPLPLPSALGVCGMPGMTAYFGLLDLGKPEEGETLVVSAAAGAVGSVVGQIGKILGLYVVGVAGGEKKCELVVDGYGFDACVDYKAGNLSEDLARACPRGIDIYFENVGGAVLDAVVPLLNAGARVPICGFISQYSEQKPVAPWDVLNQLDPVPDGRFFVVGQFAERFPEAVAELVHWVMSQRLTYRQTVAHGLENAPQAFLDMLAGKNIGKQLVRIVA